MVRSSLAAWLLLVGIVGSAQADELLGDTDRAFVATVDQQCLFATHLAGAATSQASSPNLQDQARASNVRNMKTCSELKRLADKWQIGTPGTLEHAFSEAYDRTIGLSGHAFDDAYRVAMAQADAAQGAAAAMEAASGLNPDLRGFASGFLADALKSDMTSGATNP